MTPEEIIREALPFASPVPEGMPTYMSREQERINLTDYQRLVVEPLETQYRALARDHAALLDWAARAAEALENPWETVWRVDKGATELGEQPTIRQKDTSGLLAEWAEMQERPS